jgi:hypothetical protein
MNGGDVDMDLHIGILTLVSSVILRTGCFNDQRGPHPLKNTL